jgi:hypothetical protein
MGWGSWCVTDSEFKEVLKVVDAPPHRRAEIAVQILVLFGSAPRGTQAASEGLADFRRPALGALAVARIEEPVARVHAAANEREDHDARRKESHGLVLVMRLSGWSPVV